MTLKKLFVEKLYTFILEFAWFEFLSDSKHVRIIVVIIQFIWVDSKPNKRIPCGKRLVCSQ